MSQYAFYCAKKKRNPHATFFITEKYKEEHSHNGYELDRIFGIRTNIVKDRILHHIRNSQYSPVFGYKILERLAHEIKESENYAYDRSLLNPSRSNGFTFYWGGWHSEKYFCGIRQELLQVFRFNDSALTPDAKTWKEIIAKDDFSCSLHVRRGDFLKDKKWADAITPDYYAKAIHYIRNSIPDTQFYVFSNDIAWCREQFGNVGFHYVDCNRGKDSWQDMYLMSRCRNHINANSTFSWWAAWLCPYENGTTVVPKAFISTMETKDIYPEMWVKL